MRNADKLKNDASLKRQPASASEFARNQGRRPLPAQAGILGIPGSLSSEESRTKKAEAFLAFSYACQWG
jgi:hypothetical protein